MVIITILVILVGMISLTSTSVFTQSNSNVPEWIKNNAGWWADGTIDDTAFVQGIEYLIENNILLVSSQTTNWTDENNIPSWIKNNAGWWADGTIDDTAFVQGIEWLVSNGIINIKNNHLQENNVLNSILIEDYDLIEFARENKITTQNWSGNGYDSTKLKILEEYDYQMYVSERLNSEQELYDFSSCEWGLIISSSKYVNEELETCFKLGDYDEVFVKISKFTDSRNAVKLLDSTPSEIKFVYKKYEKFSRDASCVWQFENFNESYQYMADRNNFLVSHPELYPDYTRSEYLEPSDFVIPINEQSTNSDVVMCRYHDYVLTIVSDGLWRADQFILMDKMLEQLLLSEGAKLTFISGELLDQKNMIKYETPVNAMVEGFVASCGNEYGKPGTNVVVHVLHDNFEERDRKLSGVIKITVNNYKDEIMASDTVTFNDLSYMESVEVGKKLDHMNSIEYCSYDIVSIK